jgi:hypothetical protein
MEIVLHLPTAPVYAVQGFARDSAFPGAAVLASVSALARVANEHPEARLMLFGHADESGGEAHNKQLSERRAKALLALLTQDLALFDRVASQDGWKLQHYQALLSALGVAPLSVDGVAGPEISRGTKLFQSAYNAGDYHGAGVRERAYPELRVDGVLGTRTEAALRDAYLARSGAKLDAQRFLGPKSAGCGEFNRTGSGDADRRVALALYGADFPTAGKIPCKEGDPGACKLNRKTRSALKCNFYRRTLEAEQQVSAPIAPAPAPAQPVRVQDTAGRPLAATTLVLHCAGRSQEFTTDAEGLVYHAAFTRGAPFSLELKGFAGLAVAGADDTQGHEEEPPYDPGPVCLNDWCCDDHGALA